MVGGDISTLPRLTTRQLLGLTRIFNPCCVNFITSAMDLRRHSRSRPGPMTRPESAVGAYRSLGVTFGPGSLSVPCVAPSLDHIAGVQNMNVAVWLDRTRGACRDVHYSRYTNSRQAGA